MIEKEMSLTVQHRQLTLSLQKKLLKDKEKVFLTQSITFVVRSTNILSESRTDLTH